MAEEKLDINNQPIEKKPDTVTDPPKVDVSKTADSAQKLFDKEFEVLKRPEDVIKKATELELTPGNLGEFIHSQQDALTPAISVPTTNPNIDLKKATNLIGDFNLSDEGLGRNYINALEKSAYDSALQRHEDQGRIGQAFGFLAQSIVGEIALGTLEGIGYVLDVDQWANISGESQDEVGNWFSDLMVEGKEQVREFAPIHMDPYKQGEFDPMSSSWWFSNGVSVASTVSILIPVAGWARGVGLAGKGLSTLGKMGKATRVGGKISKGAAKGFNWVDEIGKAAGVEGTAIKNIVQKGGDGINKAVISRHIESMMEASGVYREKVEELMNKGLSEEEARRISAEGAKDVYGANWVMLLQDIPQYLALGKAPKLFKAARDPKILQAQAKALGHEMNPSFWNRAAHTAGFYGKQAASEGFEEMYQYIVGEEGKHSIDVMAGLKKDNALSERLGEYSRSGEMWTSSFFGALGGAAFQAAGPTINNVVAKAFTGIEGGMTETQARITAIQNRSKIIGDINNRLSKAAELNDDAGVEVAKEQIAFELAMNAATVGNIQLDIDALDQMADMDAEQAQKAGMSPEFKEDIAFYKKKMLRAAELWQSNSLQFSPNSVAPITYRQYMMESLAERIPVAEQAIRDAVESIGVIDQMSDAGRSMFNAELQMEGKQNFVDALNHRLKNDKNMSKDQRSQLMNAIKFAETTISQEKAVLDEMKFAEGAVELTDVDKMILGGPHVKNVAKKQANLSFIDNEMRVLSQELGTLMSTEGQKASAEKMEADIKAAQNKKRDEVAKKKQEEIARGGKESTGLSGEEISAGIDSGDINERDLSQTEKDRLAKHKADLADSTPVNDETQTQKEEQPEVSQEGVARKIATGEELSEPEGQFYEANKEKIEGDVEVLDQNNTPVAPDKEIPAGEGKEVAATTEAIVHAITETPKNEDKAVDNDFTGNRAVIAETEQVHAMVQKLAWKSTNNSRTTRDHKEDPEKQALTDFLEGNHSTEGIYFVMEVDTEYQPWVMGSGVWGRRKEMFNSGKVPMSDIGKMPIKATMYRDGAPVIHNGYQLKLYVHDTEFPRTNAEIQEAHDSEVMKLKEMVVRAQLDGKRIRVDFDKKTHGNLKTTRVDNNSFSKNKLDATFNNPVSSDWVYGHDLQFLTRDGGEAFPYFPLAQYTSARSGAIYMVTDTANGSSFPVRLHVDNINTGEAAMIYEIMKVLVSENAYASPISQKFRDRMATSEDPRVRGIYDYMKMEDGREITYGDMLNHLVFSGREATMGKKDSQLWISQATPTTPAELVIGETGRYSAATINTPEAKAAIIAHLVNNRRRQIDVRMLGNKAYKQYLMENSIVTTNAAETPNKRPFVQPSVTYKNPQEVGVPVETKAGEVDAKKADIERRRQEKLELPTNGKLASKHIPKIKAASKTGDNVSNRDNKVIGVVKGLEELEGTQVKLTKEETRALQEIDNDLEFGDIDRTEAIKRRKEVYKKVFTRALESSEIGSVTSLTIEQINAKYDAELAALESQSTQQTGEVELTKAEKDKAKASSGIQAMETARQKEIDGIISVDVAGTIYYRPMTPVGPDTIYADKADVIAEINRKYDTRIDQIKDALKAKEPKVDYAVKAEIIASPQTQIEMEFDTETTATSPKAAEDAEGTVQKPLRSSSSKVSNEDWDAFVDNSEVPLHVREQIVEDLIAGNTLDERQISVYQEVGGAIEQMLRDRVIGSQPTQQTSEVIGRESIITIGYSNQVLRKNQIKDITDDINKEFPVYKFAKNDLKNPQYKFAIDLLKEKGYLLDTSGYMFTKGGVNAKTIKKQPTPQTNDVEAKKADIDNLLSKEKTIKIGRYTPSARFSDRILGENVDLEVEDALSAIVSFTRGLISDRQIIELNEVLDLFAPILTLKEIDGLIRKYENEVANFTEIIEGLNRIKQNRLSQPTQETSDADPLAEKLAAAKAKRKGKNRFGGPAAYKKVKGNTPKNQLFSDKEAEHIRTLLPEDIAVQLQDDYVRILQGGWRAVGVFQNGVIEIMRGAERGTGYHEAFHAVYRTMISAQERAKILQDAIKTFPLPMESELAELEEQHPDLNESQILELYYEEQMADEFGSWMYGAGQYTQNKKFPKGIKGFFARLWSWMKNVFSNRRTVEGMFQNIQMGKYRNMPVNTVRGFATKAHKHYTPANVREITQNLAHFAMVDVQAIEDIDKLDTDNIEVELLATIADAEEAGQVESALRLRQLYNEMYVEQDSFFFDEVNKYLISLGLKPKQVDEHTARDLTEDGDTDPVDEDGVLLIPKSYERSGKDTASPNIKLLIALTDEVITDPETGDRSLNYSGYLGLPKKVNFSEVWNKLETNLSDIVGFHDGTTGEWTDAYDIMINKLRAMSQYHEELAEIADKLENSDELIQTQFHRVFSRMKGNYMDHILSGTPGGRPVSKISSAATFTKEEQIHEKWSEQFNQNFRIAQGKEYGFNPAATKELRDQIVAYQKAGGRYVAAVNSTSGFAQEKADVFAEQSKLLNVLGISIKPRAIDKMISTFQDGGANGEQAQANQIVGFARKFVNSLTNIKKAEGSMAPGESMLMNEPFIRLMATFEAEFVPVLGENMKIIGGGNKAWTYQANNSITKRIQTIKQGDLTFLTSLQNTPFGANSVWAGQLMDTPEIRERFETALYGNYKEEAVNDKGDKASNLKKPDQLNDAINKYLSGFTQHKDGKGIFVGLAEADKGQQQYITGPNVIKSYVVGDVKGENLLLDNNSQTVQIFVGYLADELNRWAAAWEHVNSEDPNIAIPEDKQLLYYHYNLKDGKRTRGNAMGSYLFPNLKLESLKDAEGNQLVVEVDKDGNPTTPLITSKEELMKVPEVVDYIKQAILSRVREDIGVAHKYGIIEKTGDGTIRNRTINTEVLENQNVIQGQKEGNRVVNALANYTVNSMIANVEMTKLFTGDPALYKKKGDGFEDFRKRIPAATASGTDARVFKNPDGSWAVRPTYGSATVANIDDMPSTWLSKDTDGKPSDNHKLVAEATGMKANQVADLFDAYNHVNRTDAQAWITFPAYKERMRAFGKWTPAHEEAFQRVIDGKLLPADVKLFAMPLKTVHAELQLMPGGIYSMQYNKQSEAVLIPGIHDQTPLKALMDAMAKNKVDHVITLDGKKAGSVGTTDIADADFTPLEDISLNRVELNHTGLFLQQDLSTKGVKDTLVGVQTVKNVMATVKPDRIYADDMTGEQLLEDYNNVISKLSDIGLREYYKEIGWNEENQTLDQAKLRQAIIKEFEGDVSDNVIDAIQAGIPLDAVQIRRAVQYKTNAMINKKAVKLKQSGGAFVQMSDFGIMGMEVDLNKAVKDNIVWLKDPREELQPMRLEKRKDGSIKTKAAQILIPHKVLKSINQLLSQQGSDKTYKDLSAQEIKDMIDPNVLKGLIYRIPNQGPSSNDAIEIAGFLPPEMGDTIIAYSEITTKTGSDFDIDKAFAILPNYYVDYDSGKVRAVSIKKDNKGGLQNRRLWLMRKMLMHPEAYAQVMAPLDNPWLENSAKELFPGSTQAKDLQFYTGTHQLSTKSLFDNAKALVGVIANHMTHHAITVNETQLTYNVNLGIGQTNKDGLSYVSAAKDVDGKPVEETLGAFMNAIVDAAKDPYISRANINQFTANVAFMLARVGASRNFIVPFMGQPILKRLVDLNDIHEGRISETIRNEEGKRMGALDILLEEYGFSGDAKKFKTLLDTREYDLPSPGALKENIEKPQDTRDFKEKQLDILTQFLKWQEQGKNLNDLIKVSRSDVTGATKNLTSAGILNRLMSEVVKSGNFKGLDKFLGFRETTLYDLMVEQDPENQPEGLWEGDHEPITVWDQGKMLGTYYKNSVLAIRNVMRDVFFSERPAMEQSMLSIARKQGLKISATQRGEALADSLMDNLFTAINDFESSPFHVEQSELIRMIAGKAQEPGQPRPENLPISQRILNAQSDPALESNTFIQSLAISSGNIKLPWLSPKNLDKFSKDDLYLDWMALKEYAADPQLYQDMIHISFYTSGFQRGFGVFNEHIPTSFMTDNNYTGFMNQVSSSMQNPKALAHVENKVIRHLWRQNDIVPSISAKEVMQVKHKDKTFATAQVFMMSPNKSPWQVVGRNAQGLAEYKRFVKRKFTDPNSTVDTWNLYELVGYKGEGKGRLPVYAVTSKMGRSEKGIKLYEYFKEDGTTMIPSNRVSLPDMINDYISGLGNLSPIVSEEIELSDYVMTTDHLSEEQKEESNNRAAFCKKQ